MSAPFLQVMRFTTFFFLLTLLVCYCKASDYNFEHVLHDYTRLNKNGSELVQAGQGKLFDFITYVFNFDLELTPFSLVILINLEDSSCTRKVLNKLVKTCDRITDQLRSEITISYVKCRADMIGVTLPSACRGWSWTWTKCDKAIHDENPSLWSTHEDFYHGIEAACFAHTFEKQQQKIQQEILRLHETGHNITEGVLGLVNEILDLRIEHAAYFKTIDKSIQNTTAVVISVAEEVSTIRAISSQVAQEIISISSNMGEISNDTYTIRSGIEKGAVELNLMLGVIGELQEAFVIIEKSRPFLTFVNDTFIIFWHLWSMLSSLWRSYFFMFQTMYYGYPLAVFLLVLILYMWLYHFHSLLLKLSFIVVLCLLDQVSFDDFKHVSPYIFMLGCVALMSVSVVFYRLVSSFYVQRHHKFVNMRLDQAREKLWNDHVY